jgi:hypothetical protein
MVVGALPVNYYGRPRFSEDLGVAVALDIGQGSSLYRIIRQPRYRVFYPNNSINKDDPEFRSGEDLRRITLVKMRDTVTGTLVDLLLASSVYGLDAQSFDRAREVQLEGRMIRIASPEDYILMKLVSRRPATEDFQDMFTTMLNNLEALDWAYLEKRAEELNISRLVEEYRRRAETVAHSSASANP